ncbi:hypothetical protein ACSSS7_006798 [Eimeria intestinalis]
MSILMGLKEVGLRRPSGRMAVGSPKNVFSSGAPVGAPGWGAPSTGAPPAAVIMLPPFVPTSRGSTD